MTQTAISSYAQHLRRDEKSPATIEKYLRYARAFTAFLDGSPLTRDAVLSYKEHIAQTYTAEGANGMISAVNSLLKFLDRSDLRITHLRIQRRSITPPERELLRDELQRLISSAESGGKNTLALIMQTIFATGIRVSELQYITVEAARAGQTEVRLKGKIRTVLLTDKLSKRLMRHAKERGIASGPIFLSRDGSPISRRVVWHWMKSLCKSARVLPSKVFPHNLRKLFARSFYKQNPNLAELADVLGHSDINTTRIYVATTGSQLRRRLESLELLI